MNLNYLSTKFALVSQILSKQISKSLKTIKYQQKLTLNISKLKGITDYLDYDFTCIKYNFLLKIDFVIEKCRSMETVARNQL